MFVHWAEPLRKDGERKTRHLGNLEGNMCVLHYFLGKYIYSLQRISAVAKTLLAFPHSLLSTWSTGIEKQPLFWVVWEAQMSDC